MRARWFSLTMAFVGLLLVAQQAHADEPPAKEPRSRGMAAAGGLMAGSGTFVLLVATPFTISAATCDPCGGHDVAPWPLMIAGGALIAVGLPLLIVGLQSVPTKPQTASLAPQWMIQPNAVKARWVF